MPDAVPEDTVEHANRLLSRICAAAPAVICSYPRMADDAEQSPSELLENLSARAAEAPPDPGWHAASLPGSVSISVAQDRVPAASQPERLTGGAVTLQNQLVDPVTAFIGGRLAVRVLD